MDLVYAPEIAATIAVLAYIGLVFAAGVSDILTLTIPNRFTGAIVLLYPSYVLSTGQPVDWFGAVLVGAAALALGFFLFSFGWWGGGDAKLFGAVALWAGPNAILDLVLTTTIAGGAIAVFILLQYYLPHAISTGFFRFKAAMPKRKSLPMPYGVAIAVGALYGAFTMLKVS